MTDADGTPPRGTGPGAALRHDSALLHATGEARFTDDLPEPPGTLHAALALSPVARGRLLALDPGPALARPGVVAVLTAGDVPGRNDAAQPGNPREPILAEEEVRHWGQPLALVVAETRDDALLGAAALRASVEPLPHDLSVEAAWERGDHLLPPLTLSRGDPEAALAAAPHRLSGRFESGGQEHFYLEGQVALAVPGEEGDLVIHASTQHPSEVQHVAARVLGCDQNRVAVRVRRLGGAFGGKESNASWVGALAALAAVRTRRPVKLRLPRRTDMAATGKRHPVLYRWEAGFDDEGRILALVATLAADGGWSTDLSGGVVFRAVTHALNALHVADLRVTGAACRTDAVSHTAFRGFGGPQGVLLTEDVTRRVARRLGLSQEAVRERNLAGGPNPEETPYGQRLEGGAIRRVWAEALSLSGFEGRRRAVNAHNAAGGPLRRGLGSFVLAFGIAFGIRHLNQAGALVHVYEDGSIRLNHGGTEMGQGLFVKVAQVVAGEFGVDRSRIRVTATSTEEVPNTAPTAASTGSDLNGHAARLAARAVRERMAGVAAGLWGVPAEEVRFEEGEARAGNHRLTFGELAHRCVRARVSLSASGHWSTPGLSWDPATGRGEPFGYFSYAASVAEVELDPLTGEHRVLRADLVQDCGRSLNPAVDLGQVEGAFVQGLGWLTCEELWWDAAGRLRTLGPSTYKIPGSRDVPPDLRVRLIEAGPEREAMLLRSKAVGEPPLMLATAVWNALCDAAGVDGLDLPATPERLLLAARRGALAAPPAGP